MPAIPQPTSFVIRLERPSGRREKKKEALLCATVQPVTVRKGHPETSLPFTTAVKRLLSQTHRIGQGLYRKPMLVSACKIDFHWLK
jgi:uncharacterized protein YceH (UPF0502 family)